VTTTIVRAALAVLGGCAVAYGLFLVLTQVSIPDWFRLARWGLSAWLINDLVLMPLCLLLGHLVLRRLPHHRRMPLRTGLLAVGSLVIITAIAVGARAHQKNPTAEVTPPLPALLITGGITVLAVIIAELLERAQRGKGTAAG
jgi:hypothetical protein